MQTPIRNRGRRTTAAALLACLLGLIVAPPALADQRSEPPKTVQQGAWWFRKMHIAEAHEVTTGKGAKIALIDTGIDTSVPELRGADIRMRLDCRGRKAAPRTGQGADHGTTQAALLVGNGTGTGAGGAGVRGIAPDATILAYDMDLKPETARLECSTQATERMFDDAIRQGADIISVAATMGADVARYVQKALDAGVVVVAASGANDVAGGAFPSDQVGVVSVVAVDKFAGLWKLRRTGGAPTIAAPGVHVGTGGIFEYGWSSTGWSSGTSPATTITSGALALVKARYPDATGNQLLQQLVHYPGGDGPFAWGREYGFGIVSVTNMLESSPTQWPDESPLGRVVPDAVQDYPMSASSLVDDPSPAPEADGEPAVDSSGGGGEEAAAVGKARGVPSWMWAVGVAVAGVGAVLGLLTARRRRTAPAEDDETRGA